MSYTIQLRRDLASNWTSVNPILAAGEAGLETDTGMAKVGDGVTAWTSLPYWKPGGDFSDVSSVNGQTGAVVLTAAEVGADASGAATAEQTRAMAAEAALIPASAVGAASGVAALDSAQRLVTPVGDFLVPSPAPVSRRPAWRSASFTQIFQTGHGWSATGSGVSTSHLNDTSTFIKGTQCATITSAGNNGQCAFRIEAGPSFTILPGQAVRLTFQVVSVTYLQKISFYAGSSSLGNYFSWLAHTHSATSQNIVQSGEWVQITLDWASVLNASGSYSLSSTGVPSVTTGFTDMQVTFYDTGSGPVTMHLQAVEIIPGTTTTFPNGVISVVTDDSYENFWTLGRPVMDTYGYRGTSYTVAQNIGGSGWLTVAQLQQLQDFSGWEIGGHAYTQAAHNAGYDTLTALQVEDEMRYLRSWMLSNGFPADNFAYPLGHFSQTTDGVPIDQICSQYFASARSIIEETYETFPAGMPYRVRAQTGIGSGSGGIPVSTLTATGGALDRCADDGSWLVLTFHQIVTSGVSGNTQCLQSDFSTLMAAINSRGIPVLPVGDVMRNYS